MPRSLGIFILGLLLGGLAGYALNRPANESADNQVSPRPAGERPSLGAKDVRPAGKARSDEEKILLGDITTVPFQEIYQLLSRQGAERVAQIAQQLDGLPPSPEATARIRIFFKAWGQLDPIAAFASATAFHTAETRQSALGAILGAADPAAAGALASSIAGLPNEALPAGTKTMLFEMAVEKWSEVDPAAAARLLSEKQLGGATFTSAYFSVALNWAAQDPAAALAWAQAQRQVPFGLSPVNGAVLGWWKKDPAGAEAFTLAQLGTPLGKELISSMVSQMASQDRAKATAWVSQLPDKDLRNQGYTMLASQFSFSDPEAAAAWAVTLPAEAVPGAVGTVASMWARSDPAGAARWMEGLSGSARDNALSSYSSTTAETDPATATAWAAAIGDEAKRTKALQRTTRQWLERDPAAARAWIEGSSLGDEEKARLLAPPTP